jgi:hypothetical protein
MLLKHGIKQKYRRIHFIKNDRFIHAIERILGVFSAGNMIVSVYYSHYIPTLKRILNVEYIPDERLRFKLYKILMFKTIINRRFSYIIEHELKTEYSIDSVHLNISPYTRILPLRLKLNRNTHVPSFSAISYTNYRIGLQSYLDTHDDNDIMLEHHLRDNFFIPISSSEYTIINNLEEKEDGNEAPSNIPPMFYDELKVSVYNNIEHAILNPSLVNNTFLRRSKIY